MEELSLYKISLERVAFLLVMEETWKHSSVNPFSKLPSGIVEDMMEFLKYESIRLTHPLLTSGSLTRLLFTKYDLLGEWHLFLEVTRKNCFKSLRFLTWYSDDDNIIPLMETLIRSCPKLEEFNSCQIINLDVFQNCKELRVLKIDVCPEMRDYKLSCKKLAVLTSLRNLQKVCYNNIMDGDTIANILKHCPHVVSLGRNDSIEGLEKIHTNITWDCEIDCPEVSEHFQLKKCIWGKRQLLDPLEIDDDTLYKSSFPEKIRIAVSLCPFVEELVIYVSHADSIKYLKNLERLACLEISFLECESDCMPNFIALLKIIGPNLKYLSVTSRHPVPVDVVCDCCRKLENFDIQGFGTTSGSVHPHYNVSLKRLRIKKIDQNGLLFLLSSCKALVELLLAEGLCLDDSVLCEILRRNSLAKLKICDICECSLSKRGFRMFLEKAVSLERLKFATFRPDIDSVVENLIKELKLTNVFYGEMYDLPLAELASNF